MLLRQVADGRGFSWLFRRNGASAVRKAFQRPFLQDGQVARNWFEKLPLDVVERFGRGVLARHESLLSHRAVAFLLYARSGDSWHDLPFEASPGAALMAAPGFIGPTKQPRWPSPRTRRTPAARALERVPVPLRQRWDAAAQSCGA